MHYSGMNTIDDTKWITCRVDMLFQPTEADGALRVLSPVVGLVRTKAGCMTCTLGRDVEDGCLIRYAEEWATETEFLRHMQSEEFRRVLIAMDMCCEEPRVIVGNLHCRCGLALLFNLCDRDQGDLARTGCERSGQDVATLFASVENDTTKNPGRSLVDAV